ncbi:Extensin-like [Caenorhabditis elegans]|uniref:Extensin-like n=1 Tax=Caenorhabditis elegans TaxID=6239 RepID=Q9N3V0_CAEEL|nr:Extensin-like [Caenorhabditis elegans]CCD69373.1 Extensin-like [Caenorhabditis elegans]|eukprot:NP_504219.1 Uncharacterized protein CELE_Y47D7A.2 [Caenorhabditis elegans]
MRSFIIFSTLLVILVQCGYPVAENSYPTTPSYPTPPPSYPTPKKYPVAPTYPSTPSYSAPPAQSAYSSSDNQEDTESESVTGAASTSEYRKRAKARTAHNRQFQRRALQPIKRFQQKKQ